MAARAGVRCYLLLLPVIGMKAGRRRGRSRERVGAAKQTGRRGQREGEGATAMTPPPAVVAALIPLSSLGPCAHHHLGLALAWTSSGENTDPMTTTTGEGAVVVVVGILGAEGATTTPPGPGRSGGATDVCLRSHYSIVLVFRIVTVWSSTSFEFKVSSSYGCFRGSALMRAASLPPSRLVVCTPEANQKENTHYSVALVVCVTHLYKKFIL